MIGVIPKPNCIREMGGVFNLTPTKTVGGDEYAVRVFRDIVKEYTGRDMEIAEEADIIFTHEDTLSAEEYALSIDDKHITVKSGSDRGAFYAIMTLRQLFSLDCCGRDAVLTAPCVDIEDKPRFEYRGFMLDEARHFFGKDVVKKTLDMMALSKLNTFHWHLSDDQGFRVEIKKYPLLTSKGSIRRNTQLNLVGYAMHNEKHDSTPYGEGKWYSQDDIREIVEYAAALHIEVIPEIDMPGHLMSAIACYPELSCFCENVDVSDRWGVMDTIGCVGKPYLMEFVKDVLDELCPLFPSRYFHIGGDEVPKTKWKKCTDCQAKMRELGLSNEEELQGWFNNQILSHLATLGKSMIGWNEILHATQLSPDTIVQWWTGGATSTGVAKWLSAGNRAIISSGPYLYMDHFYSMKDLKKTYSLDLDRLGLDKKLEPFILGIEAPLWTEYVRDMAKFDFNTYPRMQALSEICWTMSENKNFEEFDARLAGFSKILKAHGINSAPRKAYLARGLHGVVRAVLSHAQWVRDPNAEQLKYGRT